ncbi:FAD:protein FMN transferase [Rhodobacter capsulatus]|uniref:FAD:protein FMN transferase n=1 Tax=Rhodobacter capsulatus TaxID=1061 RepID=A0A4U1JQU8_RHOCA|nr:FAD:protein FMN transferase [Rhodobacter capsulatus]TKD21381.1 FAD:protein FMN transferase [Rhodobacter capsulatus]
MTDFSRRRFLSISAGIAALAASPLAAASRVWEGIALGARARIVIDHPEAAAITAAAAAEIARLEAVFSLTRADSALSRLNAAGALEDPPFELLECLALAGTVHAATAGLFDPTVQPLWTLYATRFGAGLAPDDAEIAAALHRVDWGSVRFDSGGIRLAPGQALTLNGIAQGFIADKVAALLRGRGLDRILIDTGEMRALGPQPDGTPWPITLAAGGQSALQDRALASSSALGTTFDSAGRVGHILHPGTGRPAAAVWKLVTITAPEAGLADALSTAACLMPQAETILQAVTRFPGARVEHLA